MLGIFYQGKISNEERNLVNLEPKCFGQYWVLNKAHGYDDIYILMFGVSHKESCHIQEAGGRVKPYSGDGKALSCALYFGNVLILPRAIHSAKELYGKKEGDDKELWWYAYLWLVKAKEDDVAGHWHDDETEARDEETTA